ncbi:MAG TPA: hypothetical protein DCG22_05750 [Bacteroidetes bacterium]|nr:hypothetical protein [Bacteroidota bacterium]
MDVVIPLGSGSRWQDNELRFCLRAVEKHLKGYDRIYIVGRKPDWIQNIEFIPYVEAHTRERNIMEKVRRACKSGVSDNFLFMNDDHFLIKDVDAHTYPYYYNGPIALYGGEYGQSLYRTQRELSTRGLPTLNYDIHCPIIYSKRLFLDIMACYSWKKDLVVKSLYANTAGVEGVQMNDCKINRNIGVAVLRQVEQDRHVFSIGDGAIRLALKKYFAEKLPHPCRYEK